MKILNKIKKISGKFWQEIILIFLLILFFIGTSSFLYFTQEYSSSPVDTPDFVKWTSPDETANYIFAKLYAQEGRIYLEENYNLQVDDIMRPRSFRSDNGIMKPVSFLGIIIIYGKIASFFSYKIIPYLTPLFASIGLVFFYLLVRKIFGKQNAFWSTVILVFFPPFIYYTARSMFHNVLFTVFLVIGLYFAVLMGDCPKFPKKIKELMSYKYSKYYIFASLSGIFFGLTIITRTSELLWLAPLLLILWVLNIKRVGIIKGLLFMAFLFLAMTPMFYYNHLLYGSMFYGGYPQMNQSISTLAETSTGIVTSGIMPGWESLREKLTIIKSTIFHFGFDSGQSMLMFKNYFVHMFAWVFWPAILGLLLFISRYKKQKAKHWIFLLGYLVISFILIVYYGSWEFHDNPDLDAVTIGNSYTRYWLPVYLGAIPLASLFLMRISRMFCLLINKKIKDTEDDDEITENLEQLALFDNQKNDTFGRNFLRSLIVAGVVIISLRFVLYGSDEGLVITMKKAQAAKDEWMEVMKLTETNSAIVTRYHDKLFFPERKVIVGLFDDKNMNERYGRLVKQLPLYYYNFSLSEKDLVYLNTRRLAEFKIHIALVKKINDDFSLYKLTSAE